MLAMRGFNLAPLSALQREMFRALDDWDRPTNGVRAGLPALNVWEDGDKYFVEAEVPGLALGDVDIAVMGAELTIKGAFKPLERDGVVVHRAERHAGGFARAIKLPAAVNADNIEATLSDGVLSIVLPKADVARARRIPVKSQ